MKQWIVFAYLLVLIPIVFAENKNISNEQLGQKAVTEVGFQIKRSKKNVKLIRVINEELRTLATRFPRSINTDPDMMFRISELYFEKAKLIKQDENRTYLDTPPAQRAKRSKDSYYIGSRKYFKKAQEMGLRVLKITRKQQHKADIFLILAYNAQEFNNEREARKYFKLALEHSKPGSRVNHKSKVALAEYHYNDREYRQALNYYEDALRFKDYEWWTKDVYNMSWCYFQLKNYDQAMGLIEKIYFESKKPKTKYIDMSERAMQTTGLFYATAFAVNRAVDFYQKSKQDVTQKMIDMSRILMNKRMLNKSETVLAQADRFAKKDESKKDVYLMRLEVYESFGRVAKHFTSSRALFKLHRKRPLSEHKFKVFKYQMLNMAVKLQKQVAATNHEDVDSAKMKKAKLAARYYRMMSVVEKDQASKHNFHEGETWFSVANFNKAIIVYFKAMERCRRKKNNCDKDLINKIINSSLATLGMEELPDQIRKKYLIPVYESILKIEPVSERSQKIYVKLFNSYIEKRDLKNSERVIKTYQQYYGKDHATLEGMIARILEIYRKDNNINALLSWSERIHKKEFIVSAKYELNLHNSLAQLRFLKIQESINSGKKKIALSGYLNLYKYHLTPKNFKKDAAYNIALLYFELGLVNNTMKWVRIAIKEQDDEEVLKFANTYMAIITDLFYRRRLVSSASLSQYILKRVCLKKFKEKDILYKNAVSLYYAADRPDKVSEVIRDFSKCNINPSVTRELKFGFLGHQGGRQQWNFFEKTMLDLGRDPINHHRLIIPAWKLYQAFSKQNSERGRYYRGLIENYYNSAKKQGQKVPDDYVDIQATFSFPDLKREISKLGSIVLTFPEEKFNAQLQAKIQQLEVLTSQSLKILNIGSGVVNILVYKEMMLAYEAFVNELKNFSPPGKDAAYVTSFKQSMQSLVVPLGQKVKEFQSHARKLIHKEEILSKDNFWITTRDSHPLVLNYEYEYPAIFMDRQGGR